MNDRTNSFGSEGEMAACPRDCVLSGLRLKADTQSGVDGGNTVYIFV